MKNYRILKHMPLLYKRFGIMLYLICSAVYAKGKDPDIIELRNLFYHSDKDKKVCEQFCKKLQMIENTGNPLLLAYKGISLIMSAKHVSNPYYKISNFNKGKAILERAVQMDLKNTEIRFLRYCVQTQVPGILCYRANKEEDKMFLLIQYKSIKDENLKHKIRFYLLEWGNCTSSEKFLLQ